MFSYRDVMGTVDLQGVHRLGGYYVKCMGALLFSGLVFASPEALGFTFVLPASTQESGFFPTWKIFADKEYEQEQKEQSAHFQEPVERQQEKEKKIGFEIGAKVGDKYFQGRLIVIGDENVKTSLFEFRDGDGKGDYIGTTGLQIELNPDVNLDSATFGDTVIGKTGLELGAVTLDGSALHFFSDNTKSMDLLTLNNTGLRFANGPNITNTGIDAGGKAIKRVGEEALKEDGKAAVTTGQLFEFDKRLKNLEEQDKKSAGGEVAATAATESPSGKGTSSPGKTEAPVAKQASVTLATRDDDTLDAGDKVLRDIGAGKVEKDSSDAVTGAQLFHVKESLHGEQEQLRETLQNLKKDLSERIAGVDERASRGIASAMASAGLPQAYLPGKSMIAAATANYRGEQALSIGASTISENGNWVFKGTVNANRKDAGFSLGLGYQF